MFDFGIEAKASTFIPRYFEVKTTGRQIGWGCARIVFGLLLIAVGIWLARYFCAKADDYDKVVVTLVVLLVFAPFSLYFIVSAIKYDFGSRIVIDGTTMNINGRSWERSSLKGLVCIEGAAKQSVSRAFTSHRYKVCDSNGRTVCTLRDNFENYNCLSHWFTEGQRDSPYHEIRL